MPPIDPGASIQWAKNPRYAESLLTAISHLPQYEFDVVMVCNPAKTLSKLEQNRRKASIAQLTRRVFTTQTDTRWKTYEGSVMRKTQRYARARSEVVLCPPVPHTPAEIPPDERMACRRERCCTAGASVGSQYYQMISHTA